ncbi:MAG TPA: VWA domain-containing protein [Isosphaeraceae bacterium]|nr:VWA domain-containing protein [Isosphaeraceae bacterium]
MPDTNNNDLRIDPIDPLDDPRLTAFALDELDDPADRQAVEAILAADAAASRYVDDVRQAARLLTDALRKEPSPGLDPKHRDAIEEELMPTPAPKPEPEPKPATAPGRRSYRMLYALAAVVLIGVGLGLLLPSIPAARESGRRTQDMAIARADRDARLKASTDREGESRGGVNAPSTPPTAAAPATREEQLRRSPQETAGGSGGTAQGYGPSGGPQVRALGRVGGEATESKAGDVGQRYNSKSSRDDSQLMFAASSKLGAAAAPAGPVATGRRAGSSSEGRAMGGGGMMGGGMGGGMGKTGGQGANQRQQAAKPLAPFRSRGLATELKAGRDLAKSKSGAKDAKESQVALLDRTEETLKQQAFARRAPAPAAPGARPAAANALGAGVDRPPPPPASAPTAANDPLDRKKATGPAPAARPADGATSVNGQVTLPSDKKPDVPGLGLQQQVEPAQQAKPAQEPARPEQEAMALQLAEQPANEAYAQTTDNPFLVVRPDATDNRLSTFSIDVDTASYSNMRRFVSQGTWPPKDSVRIEEFLNYFAYNYPQPTGNDPFSINTEVARCPWQPEHRLVRIGLKGKDVAADKRPTSNLVFLLDVSGSMDAENKLPLVKASMRLLVDQLGEGDRVAIVTYAGTTGVALPSSSCTRKEPIVATIDRLQPGGSTNGGAGLELAYNEAIGNFIKGGTNRVILCTDGDFNTGLTNTGDLVHLVEEKAKAHVSLSVLGFGMGNLKDAMMEQLADKGDGNYAYIDTLLEARKHLVEQLSGTLVTIAKDVKVQVEFNPAKVAAYRLIGYEDRLLAKEDFDDDTKDAGEIGAGHTVTALYEVVPAGTPPPQLAAARALKYEPRPEPKPAAAAAAGADLASKAKGPASDELLTVFLRYKAPDGDTSKLLERPVVDAGLDVSRASDDFKFASAVASFGMLLRGSPYKGSSTLDTALELARSGTGADPSGYRKEFVELVQKAKQARGR